MSGRQENLGELDYFDTDTLAELEEGGYYDEADFYDILGFEGAKHDKFKVLAELRIIEKYSPIKIEEQGEMLRFRFKEDNSSRECLNSEDVNYQIGEVPAINPEDI